MSELRTPRLLLREWRAEDLPALKAMLQDELVMRYVLGRTASDEEVVEVYDRRVDQFQRLGYGFWAVERVDEPGLLGWTGLQPADKFVGYEFDVEVGWTFVRDAWGQGYATEAGAASVAFGFERLGLERVVAMRHPDNLRSDRVMEKLGMREAGSTTTLQGDPIRVRVLTRNEWLAQRDRGSGRSRENDQVLR